MARINTPVTVMLDRERHLLCTFQTTAVVKRTTGFNMITGASKNGELFDPDSDNIPHLLKALLAHEEEITIEQAREIVNRCDIRVLIEGFGAAIQNFCGEDSGPLAPTPAS